MVEKLRSACDVFQLARGSILDCSGKVPRFESLTVEELAQGLAAVPRFVGQSNTPRDVAQHCVMVCEALREYGCEARVRLGGLVHDDHEIVTGDIPSPVKRYLAPLLKPLERAVSKSIRKVLRIPSLNDGEWFLVKQFDRACLAIEAEAYIDCGVEWQELIAHIKATTPAYIMEVCARYLDATPKDQSAIIYTHIFEYLLREVQQSEGTA